MGVYDKVQDWSTVFVLTTSQDSLPALENVNDITVHSEQANIEVDDEEDGV